MNKFQQTKRPRTRQGRGVARGTTLIRHHGARRSNALVARLTVGDRRRLLMKIENEKLRMTHSQQSFSIFNFQFSISPLGSEGNFGGHPRRWLAAIGHRSLCASTRVLASSQPY